MRGVIVVAADDESAAAARALARTVYRDPALRPRIDEAAAQALVGEPPPPNAPASAQELAEVRRSVARATSEPVARGLLASLGASAGAALVVAVTTAQGHPVARVLRVAGASYAPLELGATVQRPQAAAAEPIFDWPSAVPSLRALLPDAGAAARRPASAGAPRRDPARPPATTGPTAPALAAGDQAASERRSAWTGWKSPWFWGPLAGVVATGVAVLVLAHANDRDDDTLRLQGRIAP